MTILGCGGNGWKAKCSAAAPGGERKRLEPPRAAVLHKQGAVLQTVKLFDRQIPGEGPASRNLFHNN